jgi:AbrB family looped-hinge helix DNA binding protein
MKDVITITRKGQTTIPAAMRRRLGIPKEGGKLVISFNERKGEITISRPVSAAALSAKFSKYIKLGIKPLTDVDAYYQEHRGGDL